MNARVDRGRCLRRRCCPRGAGGGASGRVPAHAHAFARACAASSSRRAGAFVVVADDGPPSAAHFQRSPS
ncbi:hypothetical protein WS83_00505 [Burkholderia sp. MSMB2042]|nr:hypothetical protein WS78_21930 [Burkholderia savannae]KVG37126.1 hypothetical protein WS77_23060 [Burkholderia sp. MSMB0265]KVG77750.1 hypothetical protein WS81_18320 [Burkholderia sp. MSMB2040]KVG94184.1 hypothetical protein WS83_00505 [Burkholderia sp. MSMB2042]KVG97669.1 hypothetical protein WS82_28125 [Burkholderia sp. MSMB2041]